MKMSLFATAEQAARSYPEKKPDVVVMSMDLVVKALLFMFLSLWAMAYLGMILPAHPWIAVTGAIILWLVLCVTTAASVARRPGYWKKHVTSARVFEAIKLISVGLVLGSAWLLGATDDLGVKVFGVVMDGFVLFFYIAYLGYCAYFRLPLGMYNIVLCLLSLGSAILAWHRAFS